MVLRISEARDQGEVNRYALYEKMKTMLAAPPPMHRINTKYIPQLLRAQRDQRDHHHELRASTGCICRLTTAGTTSPTPRSGARISRDGFFDEYWAWQEAGGAADVVAYLREYDLSRFNPKAPPRKTAAFWTMVGAGVAPEVSELNDVIDRLGRLETPPATRNDGARHAGRRR